MSESAFDVLILGQGLAGSLLAWQMLHAGQRVLVVDDGHCSCSSKVAAGLINPLAGMRFNCAPRTAEWLDSAHHFYADLGRHYGRSYFHAIAMQRLFRSTEQIRFYDRQLVRDASHQYLGQRLQTDQVDAGIEAPFGGFQQFQTGYLDMPLILADLRHWLSAQGALRQQAVDYQAIQIDPSGVRLGDIKARRLVFCEGYRMHSNPWFRYLPLQPDKGEFLTLSASRKLSRHIINGAHMLIPLANGGYRFGSTHAHHDLQPCATADARESLWQGVQGLLKRSDDIVIVDQQAGVRPATSDRQPFVGRHPEIPALYLFNGFGARGALTIPWYAERFRAYLSGIGELPQEADIARYRSAS